MEVFDFLPKRLLSRFHLNAFLNEGQYWFTQITGGAEFLLSHRDAWLGLKAEPLA
ncbi:hypothetical protein KBTX_02613 [wastewater metagenome]|uniref:Uncharacterized protein n=2 Tax=unclassified sequences TaxID=12908 RepID=A0A5B8RFG2_9ZZZZ|nr:hypothetical protein KBTEX_02613 [uncultured organism]